MDSVKLVSVKERVETTMKRGRKVKAKTTTGCHGCPLQESTYVPPDDVGSPRFLVIGEAPGKTEAKMLKPFVGDSGKLLRSALEKVGYGYRLINVVNCLPLDKMGNIRTPTPGEVNRCIQQYLVEEIKKFDVILLVGGTALNAVFNIGKSDAGDISITEVSGSVLISKGKKMIPVLHPSFILRNLSSVISPSAKDNKLIAAWVEDVVRVKDVIENKELPYKMVKVGLDNWEKAKEALKKEEYLVLDTETSSLDTENCVLYSLSVSGLDSEIYTFDDLEIIKKIADIFPGKKVVMHNASYDYKVLYRKGIDLSDSIVYDTMLLASVIDESRRFSSFRLKDLVRRYLGYRYWRLVLELGDLVSVSAKDIQEYNAEDVFTTRNLFKYFIEKMLTDKQISFSELVLSNAVKVVAEIEMNGMMINEANVTKVMDVCAKKVQDADAEMKEIMKSFGEEFKDVSLNSPKQLGEFIQKIVTKFPEEAKMGIVSRLMNEFKTKTGRLSVSEGSLVKIMEQLGSVYETHAVEDANKLVRLLRSLLEYREFDKLKGTFLDNFIRHLSGDKRVRASYSLIGTRTGRLSSYGPNLQNIPKNLRSVFAAKPGYVYIEADLSQIEIRVAGIIAKDEVVIEAYRQGKDLHKVTASLVSGVAEEFVTDDMRQKAKAGNFGFLYGMQWRSFKEYAKYQYKVIFSDEEAMKVRERFFETYAGFAQWHKDTEDFVRRFGYVESPFGRIYTFESSEDFNGVVRRALNYPVQGTASDLNMFIMGKLFTWKNKEKVDATFVGTVHDSMLIEVEESIAQKVLDKIKEVTKNVEKEIAWVILPIDIDVKKKLTW